MKTAYEQADADGLQRFVEAQATVYGEVLGELKAGKKESHWMWFIFPQVRGLGMSRTSQYFALRDLGEATEYLSHPVLGPRLREAASLVLEHTGRTAGEIFGSPDDMKLRSSMTLFARAAGDDGGLFQRILDAFFAGQGDPTTLRLLS